jgi:hypothetical protein|tara:strand:+ start:1411 stop:2172 length:762 start_codon:yes stop_codon:yes gene_type:complete
MKNGVKNQTACICACAKDIDIHLATSIKKLEMIGSAFKDYQIFIFENNSTDQTLKTLNDWASINSKVKIFSEDLDWIKAGRNWYKRLKVLTYARNKLLIEVLKSSPDYYIVCDIDEVIRGLNLQNFLSSFGLEEPWSMIGANQSCDYYDLWPLRTLDNWVTYDCWEECVPSYPTREIGIQKCITEKARRIPANNPPIEVESCFGGLGIYKFKHIIGCNYDPIGRLTTEHIPFHKKMRDKHNAKFFINPKMIIY